MLNNGYIYVDHINLSNENLNGELHEHPNPQFKSDQFLNLNGIRDCEITKGEFDDQNLIKVQVPYAVETPLSLVNHLLEPDEFIYYKKHIILPDELNRAHVFLNFLRVDQIAEIYINGKPIGNHVGGYTNFKFDIKPYIDTNEFDLLVKVKDVTDESFYTRGKQVLNPTGWFYTSSSGIYQTVYIEATPQEYIDEVRFTPDYDAEGVSVFVKTNTEGEASIKIGEEVFKVITNKSQFIKLTNFHAWSINDPYLYDVLITYKEDIVHSYLGIRKVEMLEENKKPYLAINGKRVILNGFLDQGYYWLGGLTPRSYKDYEFDIKITKELGYNTIRVHIKVEEPMFYYLCDKYGILVIQDFPCGGDRYDFIPTVFPRLSLKLLNKEKFVTYKRYGRSDPHSREMFINEMSEIMDETYNHPSIIIYTIFNEAWGEFDPAKMYEIFKKKDPTRLYDTASGWLHTPKTDFYSVHSYTLPLKKRKDNKYHHPYILTETGGAGLPIKDHYIFDDFFVHTKCKNLVELEKNYVKLYSNLTKQIKSGDLIGIIYTQLNDCEKEANGILTLDRKVLKINKDVIIKLNNEINSLMK